MILFIMVCNAYSQQCSEEEKVHTDSMIQHICSPSDDLGIHHRDVGARRQDNSTWETPMMDLAESPHRAGVSPNMIQTSCWLVNLTTAG